MRGDHLLVLDAGVAKRLLDPAAGMESRAAVVAVADVENRPFVHRDVLINNSATSRSAGVVTLRFSTADGWIRTLPPACSTSIASSVAPVIRRGSALSAPR